MGTKRLLCLCGLNKTYQALGLLRTNGTTLEIIPGTHNPAAPNMVTNPGVSVRLDQTLIPEGSSASLTDKKVRRAITKLFQDGAVDGVLIRHQPDGTSFEIAEAIPGNKRSNVVVLLASPDKDIIAQYAALGIRGVTTGRLPGVFDSSVKCAVNWL